METSKAYGDWLNSQNPITALAHEGAIRLLAQALEQELNVVYVFLDGFSLPVRHVRVERQSLLFAHGVMGVGWRWICCWEAARVPRVGKS